MRKLITTLRAMEPGGPQYDQIFRELMRTVLHHVADEESVLLPQAEEKLSSDLGRLGVEMTKRRLQLMKGHVGEVAATTVKSFPAAALLAGLGGIALGLMLFGGRTPPRHKLAVARKAYGLARQARIPGIH